ncbi:MAG: PPOX class F420-dependent oxidoreductase [Acidimicrobiales bacterium]
MARKIATNKTVKRNELLDFIRPRHRGVLSTTRLNGRPQMSLVTMGLDDHERVVIATYPEVDGTIEVLDLPEALDPLCDYFRSISGEHPDWSEYRAAMVDQDKSLLRFSIESWGPISQGGFPPRLAD